MSDYKERAASRLAEFRDAWADLGRLEGAGAGAQERVRIWVRRQWESEVEDLLREGEGGVE
jgi:hypothetical protein